MLNKTCNLLNLISANSMIVMVSLLAGLGCQSHYFLNSNDGGQHISGDVSQRITVVEPAIDLLFVIDNSGSMLEEQAEISNRFRSFISILNGLKWQIGITTTDCNSNAAACGDLLTFRSANPIYVLSPEIGSFDYVSTLFEDTVHIGTGGSGHETGIKSAKAAIEKRLTDSAKIKHAKLFRTDTPLAIVIVSDEDEFKDKQCNYYNMGCQDGSKLGVTPDEFLSHYYNAFGENKSLRVHSIINSEKYITANQLVDVEVFGATYESLSQKTNGIVANIKTNNYVSALTNIAEDIIKQVKSVQLSCAPIDCNNDGAVDFTIEPAADIDYIKDKNVFFKNYLAQGDYVLRYCCP